jgi:hypothetical protein
MPRHWPWWLQEAFRREPRFAASVFWTALFSLPIALAYLIDVREFQGTSIWLKPLKFHLASTAFLGTLAWFAGWLPARMRQSPNYQRYSALVAFSNAAELIWVDGAAWLGTASHYNVATPMWAALYSIMGLLAVILTSPALVYAIALTRTNSTALLSTFRWSLVCGLIVTFFATVFVAGTLASRPSHTIGTAGDLRTAHFLATHALHVIPVGGWLLSRWLKGAVGFVGVLMVTALYTALIGVAYAQALAGQPFGFGWYW